MEATSTLRIISEEKGYRCQMLIDSGADITLIPKRAGDYLGFRIEKETIREIRGIGEGALPYIIKPVQIEIGEYRIKGRIGWVLIEEVPFLLGRLDIFDQFDIKFDHLAKKVGFEK
ncbi:MAG: retropepsin-like aspartic protease [bacterium]